MVAALAGPASSVASASPGQLYAFGLNGFGQLGSAIDIETMEPNPTPVPVTLPGQADPVTQVASGAYYSLALTSSGRLYAFGENRDGQLGNTTYNNTSEANPTPAQVTLPGEIGPVTQMAAGENHSLALTSSGQLYAFGNNYWGELGNATNKEKEVPNPTPAQVNLPGELGPVTQVAAGARHSLALTSSGQLYAFGENRYGQLGNATHNKSEEPNPTPAQVTLPGQIGPVTQIAAGAFHSLAVTAGGQLYAFGENDFGQLGNANNNKSTEPNPTPAQVVLPGELGPVTGIAAGAFHSLAVTAGGQLYAFGYNRYGQLGIAANSKTAEPNPTPAQVTLPGYTGSVTRIAAGSFDSLALTGDGRLYAFGENRFGELGNATNNKNEEPNPAPTQVTLPGATSIDTMARGPMAYPTLAVVADLAVAGSPPAGVIGVRYSAQLQGSGGAPPYTWWAFGMPPGLSLDPTSGVVSGTPTALGTYTPTFNITDSDGIGASATLVIRINAPTRPGIAALPAPVITGVRQAASRWREGGALAQASRRKRVPTGTNFSFSLNEQASVSFNFTQHISGRKVGRKCVAESRTNAKRKRCTRTVTAGTLSFAGHAGSDEVRFQGRLSRSKRLKPGRYALIITATNSAGARSAPASLSFTIVR